MEEPGGLRCTGSQRVRYDLATKQQQQTESDASLEEGVSTQGLQAPQLSEQRSSKHSQAWRPKRRQHRGLLGLGLPPSALQGE